MNSAADTPVLTGGAADPRILQRLVGMCSHGSIFSGGEEINRLSRVTRETPVGWSCRGGWSLKQRRVRPGRSPVLCVTAVAQLDMNVSKR